MQNESASIWTDFENYDDTDILLRDSTDGVESLEHVPLGDSTLAPSLRSPRPGRKDESGLGRHLGLYSTTLLSVSRMVGTGIFSTPSSITNSVGSVGAALCLWTLGLVLAFCGLFVWLELACLHPVSGGEKVYLQAAFPRPRFLTTTIYAVYAIFLNFVAGACVVFAENVVLATNRDPSDWEKRGIAIAVIVFVTLSHVFVPKWSVRIMNILGSIKIAILFSLITTGILLLTYIVRPPSVPDPYASFRSPFAGSSKNSYDYAVALIKVLSTYHGWSNATYVLNEVVNPVQTIKIAGPLGLALVGSLFLLINVAYFASATPEEVSKSGVTVAAFFLGKVFGPQVSRFAALFAALSALGNIFTVTFTMSRLYQELAKEGTLPFPRFLASNWPIGSPSGSLLLVFMSSFIVILTVPFGDAYNFILDVMGYPEAIMCLFVTVGLFVLRRWAASAYRPFTVWWPLAVLFAIAQVFLIVTPFIRPEGGRGDTSLPYWLAPAVGIVILLGGALYWYTWMIWMPWKGHFAWMKGSTRLGDGTEVVIWSRKSI